MDTVTLTSILTNIKKRFKKSYNRNLNIGVYACDQLTKLNLSSDDYALIINTDPSNLPGLHWQAIWITNQKTKSTCYFFDSYGDPPKNRFLLQFIRSRSKRTVWQSKQLQSFDSIYCGEYCCLFINHMANGGSYETFFEQFACNSSDFEKNDRKAIQLFKCIFKRNCASGEKQVIQSCQSLNDCKQLLLDLHDNC